MPQPVPELQEILALEAKIRGDLYDLYPLDQKDHVFLRDGEGAVLEARLNQGLLYLKK